MKKFILAFALVLAFASVVFGNDGEHGGGGNNPEPGHNNGGHHAISDGFHNETNVSCDGTNQKIGGHHLGRDVRADLPQDHDFVGGFCLSADVTIGYALSIDYKGPIAHDKIWLCSGDGVYYPIIKSPGNDSFNVLDNGWSDRNRELGKIEADVLLSKASTPSDNSTGGGGCNSFELGFLALALLLIPLVERH